MYDLVFLCFVFCFFFNQHWSLLSCSVIWKDDLHLTSPLILWPTVTLFIMNDSMAIQKQTSLSCSLLTPYDLIRHGPHTTYWYAVHKGIQAQDLFRHRQTRNIPANKVLSWMQTSPWHTTPRTTHTNTMLEYGTYGRYNPHTHTHTHSHTC